MRRRLSTMRGFISAALANVDTCGALRTRAYVTEDIVVAWSANANGIVMPAGNSVLL
ncbi:MAG: hypothetical protein AVDCRST_MAG93-4982 [uncultured Chloroflexia bacterium]|uniref:Uncharacterized protein n=1 Tax=uncultured Chloroflexia bacterium TaxID=1672391 RepID=A0A6J4KJ30_9CHLR|nr:MAG: hypothetical protein AVDCRST_MAG93-4982 [uncultured Chloroflexia bacterium]